MVLRSGRRRPPAGPPGLASNGSRTSSAHEVLEEEEEVGGPLGQPPDEVAVPLLPERDQDPEPEPLVPDRGVEVVADSVQHLDLELLGREGPPAPPPPRPAARAISRSS